MTCFTRFARSPRSNRYLLDRLFLIARHLPDIDLFVIDQKIGAKNSVPKNSGNKKMTKGVLMLTAGVAVLLAAHEASAQLSQQLCILGTCLGGGPGHHPTPAPLLATGIPAFAALGGGVLVSRLYRKFSRRS